MDNIYRILWIDDHPEQLEGAKLLLSTYLSAKGLVIDHVCKIFTSEEQCRTFVMELRENNIYDMIMIDYDLGHSGDFDGVSLIKKIRAFSFGTMVLYSAKNEEELRQLIFNAGIDGVFSIEKNKLKDRLIPIIDGTISRMMHPCYVRGIVVGSVGEIESTLTELIIKLCEGDLSRKEKICNDIIASTSSYFSAQIESIQSVTPELFPRHIKKLNLRQKVDILKDITADSDDPATMKFNSVLSTFLNEINEPRIGMAHSPTIEENGRLVLKKKQGGEFTKRDIENTLRAIFEFKSACHCVLNK